MDPISSPSNPSIPSVVPVAKKSVLPVILIVLLILTLIGTAGYFYWQNQNLKKEMAAQTWKAQATPTVVQPSPTPTLDLTADWKTFSFEPMGHIFKYPTGWTAAQCESGIYLFTQPTQRPGTSCDTPPFGVVSITFDNKPIETGYLKSTNYVLSDEQKVTTSFGQATKRIIKLVQMKEGPGPTNYFEITFKGTNGYYYLISTENSQYETVIDQILSTFKFTE